MENKERKEIGKDELKQLIKDVAREMFITEGYQNVSMRKIATKIEYTPTTIYLYFKNKEEMICSLLEDYNQEFLNKTELLMKQTHSSYEKLKIYLQTYILHGLENPELFRLLTIYFIETGVQKKKKENRGFSSVISLVKKCIDDRYFIDSDPRKISIVLWAEVFGLASLIVFRPFFDWKDVKDLVEFSITKILDSFTILQLD